MNRTMTMAAVAVVWTTAVACMAGCGSSPAPRYYTLDMTPSKTAAPSYGIEVDRIRSSEPVARRDILVKKTPTQVEYYALDQWAGDPGQLIAEKLQAEFGHNPDSDKQVWVSGEVLSFEQVDAPAGPTAHLKLDLEFRLGERMGEPALKKMYELTVPVGGEGPQAVVEALSRGLEQAAAQMVADANAL